MADGMTLEERPSIQTLLEPNLDANVGRLGASWCPEIEDRDLRTALFENPRTRQRIVHDILSARGIDVTAEIESFIGEDELRVALERPREDVMMRLGAAWASNALAELAGRGRVVDVFPELPRDILKASLAFRDTAPAKPELGDLDAFDLMEEGALCFTKWVEALPARVSDRVFLKFGHSDVALDLEEARQRKSLCFSVLRTLSVQGALA